MAKQDKETYESYAKDMFDNPPASRQRLRLWFTEP